MSLDWDENDWAEESETQEDVDEKVEKTIKKREEGASPGFFSRIGTTIGSLTNYLSASDDEYANAVSDEPPVFKPSKKPVTRAAIEDPYSDENAEDDDGYAESQLYSDLNKSDDDDDDDDFEPEHEDDLSDAEEPIADSDDDEEVRMPASTSVSREQEASARRSEMARTVETKSGVEPARVETQPKKEEVIIEPNQPPAILLPESAVETIPVMSSSKIPGQIVFKGHATNKSADGVPLYFEIHS
jgi:hypothetical protein